MRQEIYYLSPKTAYKIISVVEVSELGAGGQSVVYKCSYNLGQEDEVLHALKLYRNPFGVSFYK